MITKTSSEREKEAFSCWKACICKVIFPVQDRKVCDTGIVIHSRIRGWSILARKHVEKLHLKVTDCKVVLCYVTFTITVCISFISFGIAGKVCPIYCTHTVSKEIGKLWVVDNVRRDRVIDIWQVDMFCVERRRWKEEQHDEEIAVAKEQSINNTICIIYKNLPWHSLCCSLKAFRNMPDWKASDTCI